MSKHAAHGVGIHRPSHVSLQEWCACDGPTAPAEQGMFIRGWGVLGF